VLFCFNEEEERDREKRERKEIRGGERSDRYFLVVA